MNLFQLSFIVSAVSISFKLDEAIPVVCTFFQLATVHVWMSQVLYYIVFNTLFLSKVFRFMIKVMQILDQYVLQLFLVAFALMCL